MRRLAMRALKDVFRPEFINRIDEVVVFDKLNEEHLLEICSLLVEEINLNLNKKNLHIEVEEEALMWLLKQTRKDRQYGARPLRRIIQRCVEDPLAEAFVSQEEPVEGNVKMKLGNEKLELVMPTDLPGVEKEEEAECPS